jgi:hypothetical protein
VGARRKPTSPTEGLQREVDRLRRERDQLRRDQEQVERDTDVKRTLGWSENGIDCAARSSV